MLAVARVTHPGDLGTRRNAMAAVTMLDPASRSFRWLRVGVSRPQASTFFVPWLVGATFCIAVMWALPGDETIPYHVAWTGFALAFGSRVWSNRLTFAALVAFTGVTGGILVIRVGQGVLAWQETAEIPLMSGIMLLLVWNVRRRQDALSRVTELAEREAQHAHDEELLTRLTSHELRSPLTIATGYVDLMRENETDAHKLEDLEIIRHELSRLSRTADRLIWVMRLQVEPSREMVDLDAVLDEAASRWSRVTPRNWVLDCEGGTFLAAPERLRVCLDTLLENAVRYTATSDTVRVFSSRRGGVVRFGVADSGMGMPASQVVLLNRLGDREGTTDPLTPDSLTQSGLGLSIVRSIAIARGGRLVAERAPEGGALVAVEVPVEVPVAPRAQPVR